MLAITRNAPTIRVAANITSEIYSKCHRTADKMNQPSGNKNEINLRESLWDLSSYVGQSTISEAHANVSLPVKERVRIAEEVFG